MKDILKNMKKSVDSDGNENQEIEEKDKEILEH